MNVIVNNKDFSSVVNETIREMRLRPYIESDTIAVVESNGMQVQIVVTRNKDDFIEVGSPND